MRSGKSKMSGKSGKTAKTTRTAKSSKSIGDYSVEDTMGDAKGGIKFE